MIKVLLCEDVDNLGWYGDVVSVKDGYARNYLLPQRLAVVPSEAIIKKMADEKARRAEHRNLVREQLERLAQTVQDTEVEIIAKANDLGHLFGSVTEKDIASQLRQRGFEITDAMVRLSGGHIKELGSFDVSLKLAADIRASIRVMVKSEQVEDPTVESNPENTEQE